MYVCVCIKEDLFSRLGPARVQGEKSHTGTLLNQPLLNHDFLRGANIKQLTRRSIWRFKLYVEFG